MCLGTMVWCNTLKSNNIKPNGQHALIEHIPLPKPKINFK